MMQGKLKRAYYCSVGQQLTVDTLSVEFEVNGEMYTHRLPNQGWGYMVPALQFMAYADIKPTDFEASSVSIPGNIHAPIVEDEGEYYIATKALQMGMKALHDLEWFNPEGDVWNSGANQGFGGMSVDPSTGNRAAVDGEPED